MRIHHLNCGTMPPLGGRIVDGEKVFLRCAEMACHCLLLETDSGLVLVDTGIGSPGVYQPQEWLGLPFLRAIRPVRDEQQTAVAQIQRLGFAAEDVRHIVLTHLDLDHAGGLVDFPDATVHVYERELWALQAPKNTAERVRYRKVQFEHGPRWRSYATSGQSWFGCDAVGDLDGVPPDVLLVPLAGHTRGHAGVAVDTGDGWLLHAGDAYSYHAQLDPQHPHCPPALKAFELAMQTDRSPRVTNQRRLRDLSHARSQELTIFSAHSATEMHQMERTDG